MGNDDDVGAFASGCGHKELVADASDVFDNKVNIVGFFEFSSQLVKDWGALFVCPNAQCASRFNFGCINGLFLASTEN